MKNLAMILTVLTVLMNIPNIGADLKKRLSGTNQDEALMAITQGEIYFKKLVGVSASSSVKLVDILTESIPGISNINKGKITFAQLVNAVEITYAEAAANSGAKADTVIYSSDLTASFANADFVVKQGDYEFRQQLSTLRPGASTNPNERSFELETPFTLNDTEAISVFIEFGPNATPKADTLQFIQGKLRGPRTNA